MTEEVTETTKGEIHITITDENIIWNSEEFDFQQVHFWLDMTLESMKKQFLSKD